jgi:hypothetical protein
MFTVDINARMALPAAGKQLSKHQKLLSVFLTVVKIHITRLGARARDC